MKSTQFTVWNFMILLPLRFYVINFGDFLRPKTAILTHFETLNFDFYGFLHLRKLKFIRFVQSRAPKITMN